ncbi:hypothetical protein DY000_02009378, partial [Brassica cretica]
NVEILIPRKRQWFTTLTTRSSSSTIDALESYGSKLLAGCYDGSLRIYSPQSSSSSELTRRQWFTTLTTRSSSSTIDALESYGSKLLAGCYDGSLRIYSPQSSSSSELRQEPYVLETTVSGFSKKPIVSMKTVAVVTKAKGANAYAWDDGRGFLCFSRQKRVCIFKHDGGGFVEVRDFGVPDTVKSISWCGENICLGIRKEYVILNTANGTLSEVFPSGRVSPPLVTSLPSALALCKSLPPEDSSLRAAKESSIHTRFAHYLFENGSYEEAMEHFLASQVDITHVLSMYPSIILPKTTMIPEPDKNVDISGDEAALSRGSSGFSDDMESSSPRYLFESEGSAALESKKMSHNTLMALIKYLQKRRPGMIEKATSEGTEEVISDAVGKDVSPLNSGAREMAATLDTALLQALLHTGQSEAAVDLLKGVNYCDVNICEVILMTSKNYPAQLELFKSNSMHHEALKLLKQLLEKSKSNQSQTNVTQMFSPELIIEYLKPLCRTDPMLHAPNMQGRYLELMMAINETAVSGNLHNEMVQIYLSEVLDLHASQSAQQKCDDKDHHPPERKKLLSALESISGYNPQTLLKRLPHDALFEERAVILGKMNQHELAMSIYVHKVRVSNLLLSPNNLLQLHAPDRALAYCDRIYESISYLPSGKPSSSIYLTLLQVYLNPKKSAKDFAKRIVALGSFESSDTTKMMESVLSSKVKGGRSKKIVAIEGAEEIRAGLSSSTDSGRSDVDAEEPLEEGNSSVMISESS